MLFRFSLYGFLKSQRYFEPFIILAFLSKGLGFLEIGILIAFRECAIAAMEIPSGAIADLFGRRRAMIVAFIAYLGAFILFGVLQTFPLLFPAMLLFAVGEAFRTGTHKAMIFSWLRLQGREAERTRVYGRTRFWSKIGSACSTLIAATILFGSTNYDVIFILSALPCILVIVNFFGYPGELDGQRPGSSRDSVYGYARRIMKKAVTKPHLRRLVLESMGFEGIFHAAKDYLQPILAATALLVAARWIQDMQLAEEQTAAIVIGTVTVLLHFGSAVVSRQAHRVARAAGGEDPASWLIWIGAVVIYLAIAAGAWLGSSAVIIPAFVLLHLLQNLWKPMIVSRFAATSEEQEQATMLSVESQARRISTMIVAPVLGAAVDATLAAGSPEGISAYWPVGVLGGSVALLFAALTLLRPAK